MVVARTHNKNLSARTYRSKEKGKDGKGNHNPKPRDKIVHAIRDGRRTGLEHARQVVNGPQQGISIVPMPEIRLHAGHNVIESPPG